jgi:ElaB/YqjD/DUF883 family membrane-anchored ribosome-binding protein
MNSETSQTISPSISANGGLNGDGKVHRVAQKAHEVVDKLEQSIGAGSEKVTQYQQEYGDMCREQVKAHPLVSVAAAFGVGVIFSKLFLR